MEQCWNVTVLDDAYYSAGRFKPAKTSSQFCHPMSQPPSWVPTHVRGMPLQPLAHDATESRRLPLDQPSPLRQSWTIQAKWENQRAAAQFSRLRDNTSRGASDSPPRGTTTAQAPHSSPPRYPTTGRQSSGHHSPWPQKQPLQTADGNRLYCPAQVADTSILTKGVGGAGEPIVIGSARRASRGDITTTTDHHSDGTPRSVDARSDSSISLPGIDEIRRAWHAGLAAREARERAQRGLLLRQYEARQAVYRQLSRAAQEEATAAWMGGSQHPAVAAAAAAAAAAMERGPLMNHLKRKRSWEDAGGGGDWDDNEVQRQRMRMSTYM